jgi:hypothetical protein
MKTVGQIFFYTASTIGFIYAHFYYSYYIHKDTKLSGSILQDLLPN